MSQKWNKQNEWKLKINPQIFLCLQRTALIRKASLAPHRHLVQIKSMISLFLFLREGRNKPVVLEYGLLNANREVPSREPQYLQATQRCACPPLPGLPLPFACLPPFPGTRELINPALTPDITTAKQTLMTFFFPPLSPTSLWAEVDNKLCVWHWHSYWGEIINSAIPPLLCPSLWEGRLMVRLTFSLHLPQTKG